MNAFRITALRWTVALALVWSVSSDRVFAAEVVGGAEWNPLQVERELRSALERSPSNFDQQLALANHLSYQTGKLDEAIAHYRKALKIRSGDRSARHGLARSFAWAGHSKQAMIEFDSLIAEDPNDPEARFGRGQVARWGGDHVRARRHLVRALDLAPENTRYREEYARLELDAGRPTAAAAAAAMVRRLGGDAAELEAEISAAFVPKARVRGSASEETNDFRRATVTMESDFAAWKNARILVEAGYTRFEDDTGDLDRVSLGIDATQPLPLEMKLLARYALRKPLSDSATHEAGLEIAGRPLPLPVVFRVGGSRHSLVDQRRSFEEIEPLQGVGSGGNSLDAIRNRRQMGEAYGGVSITPVLGTYVYAEFAAGWISDGNRRLNAVSGAGLDLMALARKSSKHAVNLQYGLYFLDYTSEDDEYFSPRNFIVHTPSVAWRWQPDDRFVVGLEAGAPVESGERFGWLAGGFAQVRFKKNVSVGARMRHMENASYRITSATLGVQLTF